MDTGPHVLHRRIAYRSMLGVFVTAVAVPLLVACGGGGDTSTPTTGAGAVVTRIAPIATTIASVAAPVETRVATVVAPLQTQVATVVAPAETRVATALAPVTTRVATAFDPLISTVDAQIGGVRPAQGACPADHAVKGRLDLVPPRREYWLPGSAGYDQAVATICFATEADAQKALYRKANP